MDKIVLLGDSIFDNATYVNDGPDVRQQLADALGPAFSVQLAAVDGAMIENVPGQISDIPLDVRHVFLSAGGNDALNNMEILTQPVRTVGEALMVLGRPLERFRETYKSVLEALVSRSISFTVCTIYEPNFDDSALNDAGKIAVRLFDDTITQEAARAGAGVIDLRLIFTEPSDYANPIEPSVIGGAKLANAMTHRIQSDQQTGK